MTAAGQPSAQLSLVPAVTLPQNLPPLQAPVKSAAVQTSPPTPLFPDLEVEEEEEAAAGVAAEKDAMAIAAVVCFFAGSVKSIGCN